MQIEAVAALVASGAAVLGVPAALVVGLRQAHAARQAAELAAGSARDQWRSSTRREAAVAFVLEADRALEEARRLSTSYDVLDLEETKQITRALWRAMAVVRIEGPKPLSDVAAVAYKTVNEVLGHQFVWHVQSRPQLLIRAAAFEGNDVAKRIHGWLTVPERREGLLEHPMWAELAASGVLPTRELRRLENHLRWPTMWPSREDAFFDKYDRARREIDAFIEAVHTHFDGTPPQ
ncbi:hypothetical protein ABT174_35230 [Streptomyces sparsogenes]|uniref:hypothetical protein n=1 Tax=Streptomyces sparsogenes TaxID=67365 RepID=UPI0033284B2E